ncbi:MAG: sigma-70 family RNA polymerase sigma factor [Planctomycetota bacterium]
MPEDPDFDLVRRCQSEDLEVWEGAFEELFERYRDRVYNAVLRIVGHPEDALDVTQETFVTVFRSIDRFQFGARFFTWLYRIAMNLAIDRKKRERGQPLVFSHVFSPGAGGEIPADAMPAAESSLERRVEEEHAEKRVQSALSRLSPKLRAIVVLRYIEELSYAEIGEILGCSLGTVKSRLNRAHRSLQEFLEPTRREQEGARG